MSGFINGNLQYSAKDKNWGDKVSLNGHYYGNCNGYTTCDSTTVSGTTYNYRTCISFKIPYDKKLEQEFDGRTISAINTITLQIGVCSSSSTTTTKLKGYLCTSDPTVNDSNGKPKYKANPPPHITTALSDQFTSSSVGELVTLTFYLPKNTIVKAEDELWVWFSITTNALVQIWCKDAYNGSDRLHTKISSTRYIPPRLYTMLQTKWRDIYKYAWVDNKWRVTTPWVYMDIGTVGADWGTRTDNSVSVVKDSNQNVVGVWIKCPQ